MDIDDIDIELRDGDVIFISIPTFLYRQVEKGTASRASHVGILFRDGDTWIVAESKVPLSVYTPLASFLERTKDDWCCIRRPNRRLNPGDIESLRSECDARMGKLYHFGFKYDSSRQFCSKFVYDSYRSALGIEVGELDTLRNLYKRRPNMSIVFWKLWYFGMIPWNRRTITPASQMETDVLETVYTS